MSVSVSVSVSCLCLCVCFDRPLLSSAGTAARQALDEDLSGILYGAVPRAYGEMPRDMGLYTRICPGSASYDRVTKVKHAHLRPKAARVPAGST